MKCARITAPKQLDFIDRPADEPGPGEVRLRTAWIGLCGSDLSTWRGVNPLVTYPRIPGHEVSGTVEAIGPGVTGFAMGDRALVIPYTACGACTACLAKRPNCCRGNQTLGVQRDGALAGSIVVPAAKLMAVPGLDLRDLVLVEPLSVGFHAIARAHLVAGETVAVVGCGAVGIGAVAGAASRGARVIALDIDKRKLDLARALGASEALDVRDAGVAASLATLTDSHGPAVMVEATGQPDSLRLCLEATCFAGRVACIGYAKGAVPCDTTHIIRKELDVLGSRNAQPEDFTAAAAWIAGNRQRAAKLVSHVVGFHEVDAALAMWDADPGSVGKILVTTEH